MYSSPGPKPGHPGLDVSWTCSSPSASRYANTLIISSPFLVTETRKLTPGGVLELTPRDDPIPRSRGFVLDTRDGELIDVIVEVSKRCTVFDLVSFPK